MFGAKLKKAVERSEQLLDSLKRRYELLNEMNQAAIQECHDFETIQQEQKIFGPTQHSSTLSVSLKPAESNDGKKFRIFP